MANTRTKKGASKVRHLGRHKAKIARYYEYTYPMRKLRHLLKHNSEKEARIWAKEHAALVLLDRLVA